MATKTVRTAFGVEKKVTLESGREFRIQKWSVRKIIHLSESISSVIENVFEVLRKSGNEEVSIADLIGAIPQVLQASAEDFARIVESSLTLKGGEKQITFEQILGDDEDDPENLDWDEFAEVAMEIINANLTVKTMGKFKALLTGSLTRLGVSQEKNPTD